MIARISLSLSILLLALGGLACGRSSIPAGTPSAAEARAPYAGTPEVIVVERHHDAPAGSDGAPRMTLAFRYAGGAQLAIEGEALAYAPFRDGVALVDVTRQLVVVSPDGSRRVLAYESGAPPATGPRGELYYVARYATAVELHMLQTGGTDRVIADGLSNAGVLTPEADGTLLLVGARNGGVAGIWVADTHGHSAVRCVSNCELKTGSDWGTRYETPPGSPQALRDAYARLRLLTHPVTRPDAQDKLGGAP